MDDSSHGGQRPVVSQYDFAPRHSVLFIRRFVATDGLHHRPSARDLNIPKLAGIHDCNPSPWCFGLAHLLVGFGRLCGLETPIHSSAEARAMQCHL